MTHQTGSAVAMDHSEVFAVHLEHFSEMIQEKPILTEALVHHMASRIRNCTAMCAQNEKLISLGKLSAGLAHELNNPASAMVSTSEALLKHLRLVPEVFKGVMTAKIEPELVDYLNTWLFDIIDNPRPKVNLFERTKAEDQLTDWLDDQNFEDSMDLAEVLVDYQVLTSDVEKMQAITGEEGFQTTLRWIANNLATEKLVGDIRDSAHRRAGLIWSLKDYNHMDRVQDRQPVDINAGIRSTLRTLGRKIKSGKIEVEEHLHEGLP